MSDVVYLDTSAVLRSILEDGPSPDIAERISSARFLITSRLSLVETARALLRLRASGAGEAALADAARDAEAIWSRCTLWELTPAVCELAAQVAPLSRLRTLDALHAATWIIARRQLSTDVEMVTADHRLRDALAGM